MALEAIYLTTIGIETITDTMVHIVDAQNQPTLNSNETQASTLMIVQALLVIIALIQHIPVLALAEQNDVNSRSQRAILFNIIFSINKQLSHYNTRF